MQEASLRSTAVAYERRKLVPKAQAIAIIEARANWEDAEEAFEQAIIAALRAGGSYREVAGIARKATRTIELIAKRHGWPDKQELAKRERHQAARVADEAAIEHYRLHGRLPD